jgi:hypothetical protein
VKGKADFGNKTSALLGDTDDIVEQSKQARENVLTTMLEANLLPGTPHLSLEAPDDVEAMYRQVAEQGENTLVVYRVPRAVAEQGWQAGAVCAATVAGLPEAAHGRVWLSFDGWADDRRELFEIPCVVEWCRGFLFVSVDKPWQDNAKRIVSMLFDEDTAAFDNGKLVDRDALNAPGSIWLCSAAFASDVYMKDPNSPSGWSRDYSLAFSIREWLAGRASPPGS